MTDADRDHDDMDASPPQTIYPRPAARRDWIALGVLALPTMLIAMDMTVLHLAVPELSADLQPTSLQLLWIVDIYGFMIAGLLIVMGTLGDRIGRRRLLLGGASAFGIASILAAFSTSAEMLILTRALLGIAGATLMPSTLSLIRTLFEVPQQRTTAISVWMISFMIGTVIGPLVGGIMLAFFWWGSVFLLAVPVMALLLSLGPLLLPEYKDPSARRLDLASTGLLVLAMVITVYGIKGVARDGVDAQALGAIAVGIVIGVFFVRRQRSVPEPMIDLGLFASRAFSTSVAMVLLSVLAMSGTLFMMFQYLQGVLGLTPLAAGLWTLPGTAAGIASSMAVPRLVSRVPPGRILFFGLALGAAGLSGIALVDGAFALPILVAMSITMHIGLMPVMILGTDLIVGSAPQERAGTASAISETGAELGMALGIAIIGSIGTAVYRTLMMDSIPAGLPDGTAAAAMETLGGALKLAGQLPDGVATDLLAAARNAFTQAFHINALVGGAIIALVAIAAGLLLRHVPVATLAQDLDHEEASSATPTGTRP